MMKLYRSMFLAVWAVLFVSDAKAELVVDLEFGTGDAALNRSADVDTSDAYRIAWDAGNKFYDGDNANNQDVYAGYALTGAGTVGGAALGISDAQSQMQFIGLNASAADVVEQRALVLWDSADFLVSGFRAFDSTAESSLTATVEQRRQGAIASRFVIRDGSTYYMSSVMFAESGSSLTFSLDGSTTGLQWGNFDPNSFDSFDDGADGGLGVTFSAMTFSNVTGVGMISFTTRGSGNAPEYNYMDFQARLVSGPQDPGDPQSEYLTTRPPYAGVWVNTFGKDYPELIQYTNVIAGEADRPQWGDIEQTKGSPDFSELDASLQRCIDRDYYYYAETWTAHNAPDWLYNNGVPLVEFQGGALALPYYLDEDYIHYVTNFFNEMAGFIAGSSPAKRERIAFLQVGFGSTGDRQLYKDMPVNSAYEINSDQYLAFMQTMTIAWHDAFAAHPETQNIRFLWNIDDYDGSDPTELVGVSDGKRGEMLYAAWMRANYNCQFRKQQFTQAIGYMACSEQAQEDEQRDFFYGVPGRHDGNPEFVRGEFNDAKWMKTDMATRYPQWHYYWTGISSVDRGLDGWETKPEYILTGEYNEAYAFSTRYSYYKDPKTSPVAFIALRDVLDYSDASRFSHLPGSASRTSTTRINAILAEYAPYGATNEDTTAVINSGQSSYLLNSTGMNDCVWDVIDRNYRRHMSQSTPNDTSVGLWRVGSTNDPYGRFARAFENASGKNAMYFNFDTGFFIDPINEVTLKVIYYDNVAGSTWDMRYDAMDGWKTALSITNTGSGEWKTVEVTVDDAFMAGNGPNGSDLALVNTDGLDDVFHLIEVEKLGSFSYYDLFSIRYALLQGREGDDDNDGLSNFGEYALNGNPTNAASRGIFSQNIAQNGSVFTISYASNVVDGSLVYTLLDRTNLVTGSMNTNAWDSQTVGPATGDYLTVSNHYNSSVSRELFIRLDVEKE